MNRAADWYAEQEYRERCGMPHEGKSMPKQKISNGDRIRQMTDEELAEFIDKVTDCCSDGWMCEKCPINSKGCDKDRFIAWLKQEAKDDDKR